MKQTNEQIAHQYADNLPSEQLPWEIEGMDEAREAVYQHTLAVLNLTSLPATEARDSSKNYDQLVRERTEEFAIESMMKSTWDLSNERARDIERDKCRPLARLSVQREAEAFENGWIERSDMLGENYNKKAINKLLQSLGLVPSPENKEQ